MIDQQLFMKLFEVSQQPAFVADASSMIGVKLSQVTSGRGCDLSLKTWDEAGTNYPWETFVILMIFDVSLYHQYLLPVSYSSHMTYAANLGWDDLAYSPT